MKQDARPGAIDRRTMLRGVGMAGVASVLLARTNADAQTAEPSGWEAELKKILGDAKPEEGKITLDMPEIAENGNTVPFSLVVDSPMTDASYVKNVHVLSTGNPQPAVATFHFFPASGKATISSRMRLASSQDVVAVAETSDGKFAMVRRNVKVTIGGCGG